MLEQNSINYIAGSQYFLFSPETGYIEFNQANKFQSGQANSTSM